MSLPVNSDQCDGVIFKMTNAGHTFVIIYRPDPDGKVEACRQVLRWLYSELPFHKCLATLAYNKIRTGFDTRDPRCKCFEVDR